MTIGYTIVKAFKTGEDTDKVERQLHAILPIDLTANGLINPKKNKT